jgi:hypothetical protein
MLALSLPTSSISGKKTKRGNKGNLRVRLAS